MTPSGGDATIGILLEVQSQLTQFIEMKHGNIRMAIDGLSDKIGSISDRILIIETQRTAEAKERLAEAERLVRRTAVRVSIMTVSLTVFVSTFLWFAGKVWRP